MHAFTVPSAFTVRTGAAHWDILLRARAIETQSYVIASAQAGKHSEKRESNREKMPLSKHRRKGRDSLGWENETVPTSTDL